LPVAVLSWLLLLCLQDKANLERQLKQLNSRSSLLEKNLEKKDAQVCTSCHLFRLPAAFNSSVQVHGVVQPCLQTQQPIAHKCFSLYHTVTHRFAAATSAG
jgi:hypothetical protein